MACFGLTGPGSISEAAFTYMDLACALSSTADSLEGSWVGLWVVVAVGLTPFLFALLRGKAGYPTLAIIAAVSIYCSFVSIQGMQGMRSEIDRIELTKRDADFSSRPPGARQLAEVNDLVHILDEVTVNNTRIQRIEMWIILLQYISGCLVVIAGWSSTAIMSRRIKVPR
ncbi:hypothetical protein MARSALSMR5_04250 (plasmid) [Marinobacter salarius]|uniref:Uncharacterized protein n=1 Tax=Marinobacter salarius TaxID=1420917 RepID=A0A1W6KFT0_9GAMM|nr:hypothetical protein MARSALSMR5_04250 [Marinobacter salarius]